MLLLLASFELLLLFQCGVTSFIKKYAAEVENYEICPNNEQTTSPIRNLKFTRYNRTHGALSYDITFNQPLDEKVGGLVTLEKWGDGGWIKMPFIGFQSYFCRYMLRFFTTIWVKIHKSLGVVHPDRCPIPAGNYSLKNFIMDYTEVNLPFWSGRFRFTTQYQDVDTKKYVFCSMHTFKVSEVI